MYRNPARSAMVAAALLASGAAPPEVTASPPTPRTRYRRSYSMPSTVEPSQKRQVRRSLGWPSGRQWRKLRKAARRH